MLSIYPIAPPGADVRRVSIIQFAEWHIPPEQKQSPPHIGPLEHGNPSHNRWSRVLSCVVVVTTVVDITIINTN